MEKVIQPTKEKIRSHLKTLTAFVGVSGSEQTVVTYLKEQLSKFADDVSVDSSGNVIAVKHGKYPGPRLMVTAHSDEIGFCVKNILEDGFIIFDKIGGVPDLLLQGRKVWISSKKIPGIIGVKPGHLQSPEEAKQIKSAHECYIDTGASSKEAVERLGIKVGDSIVFQSDFMEMFDRDLISTKAIDNRVNCAVLLELFEEFSNSEFSGTLYGVVTVQEEVGLRGSAMIGNKVKPDYAIVLDTIPAGDTPDIDTERKLPVYLGRGPVCPIGEGLKTGFAFHFIHPSIRRIIEEQSEKQGVAIQYLTLIGDYYVTDASNLSKAHEGIPTGVIATPRRYSHSPVELVNLNDVEAVLKLLVGVIKENGENKIDFV